MSEVISSALPVGGGILSFILQMAFGLIINFIPSGLAYIKGNSNFRQIFMINLMMLVITFILNILVFVLAQMEFITIVMMVLGVIWGIICIIIWIITLIKAIRGY